MFSAFVNSWKIPELRKRIFLTIGLIALCRVAANIPCPGVDPAALNAYIEQFTKSESGGMFMGMFDLFSGGALQKFAIATLGIMPYISASIIMQLLIPVLPNLEKLSREGDVGRQKINQYTRYLTLAICLVQGTMAAFAMVEPGKIGLPAPTAGKLVLFSGIPFVVMTVIVLTAGTMVLMWLGEQITERGIGNGASLIITVNIICRMPQAFYGLWDLFESGTTATGSKFKLVHILLLLLIFAVVTAATIALIQGQRRIPIQMAKRAVGSKMQGGTTYMPLKVNYSGVMPIIFANALLIFPSMILQFFPATRGFAVYFIYGEPVYMICFAVMIMLFSFFWVANQFNPIQIADNLKKEGAYVPGIRPGKPTSDFLEHTMVRITLAGAIFLTGLAIFPMLLTKSFGVPFNVASFFGGTSLLIIVGVLLDTLTQMESHLVMRNYDGFLKRGKLRGRRRATAPQT